MRLPDVGSDVVHRLREWLADRHAVPVIPFGVGSSLEGHLLAVQGGISVDVSRMKSGTRTMAPVSSSAGLPPPVAVSPRTPGSDLVILSST